MIIKDMHLENFGSYTKLDYDFHSKGLSLVYGPTGAGKSTLLDGPMWVLFGITAKDGAADDVRAWISDESTTGELTLEINQSILHITRIRGTKNDLYWSENERWDVIRGKDATETQKMLNERLGLTAYLYTLGAYYNEFSPTGQFFTDKAADRRTMFDSLADLSFPTTLSANIVINKKELKTNLNGVEHQLSKEKGKLEYIKNSIIDTKLQASKWEDEHQILMKNIKWKETFFETERQKDLQILEHKFVTWDIAREDEVKKLRERHVVNAAAVELSKTCPQCKFIREVDYMDLIGLQDKCDDTIDNILAIKNPIARDIEVVKSKVNPYTEQVEILVAQENPFKGQVNKNTEDFSSIEANIIYHTGIVEAFKHKLSSLVQLQGLVDFLRGELIKSNIKNIESETNRYLETYFDAEFRVIFSVVEPDKLDIIIYKSGHECSYKQLSKGQRSLLKLCFSLSVMKATSNKVGVHFDFIGMDEALDGMDEEMKLKTFRLFSELSKHHSTVIVIDHDKGLQNLFDRKFEVSMNADISSIEEV
jgi:DNA repair exonuclease SbcCD ATPase subunit